MDEDDSAFGRDDNPSKTSQDVTIEYFNDVDALLPLLDTSDWNLPKLSDEEWKYLEEALKVGLNDALRQRLCEVLGHFIHTLRLKDELPTPRRYYKQLVDRIDAINFTADNLLAMIQFVAPPPADDSETEFSEKEARERFGGHDSMWTAASRAAKHGSSPGGVRCAEDHIRLLLIGCAPKIVEATMESTTLLLRVLSALRRKIKKIPHNSAGADGDFELNLLLLDLLRIVRDAGVSLDLPDHRIRDEWENDRAKLTPAYVFIELVIKMMDESSEKFVDGLLLPEKESQALKELLKDNLGKDTGTYIDALDRAKAIVIAEARDKTVQTGNTA